MGNTDTEANSAIFDIVDAPQAIKEIAHQFLGVQVHEPQPDAQSHTVRAYLTQAFHQTREHLGLMDTSSNYLRGYLFALPGCESHALLVGTWVNRDMEPNSSTAIRAYALPIEEAEKLEPKEGKQFELFGEGRHIPVVKNASVFQPLMTVSKEENKKAGLSQTGFSKWQLEGAGAFLDDVLDNFWVNAYEPRYLASKSAQGSGQEGVLLSMPSLLRITALCLKVANDRTSGKIRSTWSYSLSKACEEMNNYALIFADSFLPFYNYTQDALKEACWERAIRETMENAQFKVLEDFDMEDMLSLSAVKPENANINRVINSPKAIICLQAFPHGGTEPFKYNNPANGKPYAPAQAIESVSGYSALTGRTLSKQFAPEGLNHTTNLFEPVGQDSKKAKQKVQEIVEAIDAMTGEELEYEICEVQRYERKRLAQAYFYEMSYAVENIVKMSKRFEDARTPLPF